MNGLTWIDFFLRVIPEGLIIILAGYAVSKKAMNIKLYLLSSVFLGLITFGLKNLPVSAVFPVILSAITAVLLLGFINKIKVIYAIISTTVCLILSVLVEGINLFALEKLLKIDTYGIYLDATPILRILYGLPSLLIFAAIVIPYYFISRRKTKKNVINE